MNEEFSPVKFLMILISWLFLIIVGGSINNKLYDIREHMNGTCVLENTYNGICR